MSTVQLFCGYICCYITLCSFPETHRNKTADYTPEEKTGVLFRFNAGNCCYGFSNLPVKTLRGQSIVGLCFKDLKSMSKLRVVTPTYNLNTWEAEAEGSLSSNSLGYRLKFVSE